MKIGEVEVLIHIIVKKIIGNNLLLTHCVIRIVLDYV